MKEDGGIVASHQPDTLTDIGGRRSNGTQEIILGQKADFPAGFVDYDQRGLNASHQADGLLERCRLPHTPRIGKSPFAVGGTIQAASSMASATACPTAGKPNPPDIREPGYP